MGTPSHCCAGSTSLLGASWALKLKEKLHLLGNHAFEVTVWLEGSPWGNEGVSPWNTPNALELIAVPSGDTVWFSV